MGSDGGPAFPFLHESHDERKGYTEVESSEGMTLRQWYAGQVLAGWSETHHEIAWEIVGGCYGPDTMATIAFQIADAMIEAERASEQT